MTHNIKHPKTLQEAIQYYGNEKLCIDTVAQMRWHGGKPECPACGHTEHYYLATQKRWKCKECWKQFSVKVGTIFEDSPLSLTKWLPALWMLINCKNGISSYELSRALGVSQKSAWHMLHRLRLVLQSRTTIKLGGSDKPVEVDETFIGGLARNMHHEKRKRVITGPSSKGKTPVLGMLERDGQVRAWVVPNVRKKTIQPQIYTHVDAGSALYTDALLSYWGLIRTTSTKRLTTRPRMFADRSHTNGMENFWSLLKRQIRGTYISVEPFHLFRYLDEQVWRYNNRATKERPMTDSDRFKLALSAIGGKRLTFNEVIGKGEKQVN